MSSRDWSTIGTGSTWPRWICWSIPPLLIPPLGVAVIVSRWDSIPLRYGKSLLTRTPLHLFSFLIFGEGLAALLLGLMLAIWFGSRRPATLTPLQKIPLAVSYMLSAIFTLISAQPALGIPDWPIAMFIPVTALAVIVYVIKAQADDDTGSDTTPNECWSLGGIYYNPKDPSLFVPARIGYGYTLNMANPMSHRIIGGFIGGVAVLVGFLIWALRT